MNIRTYKNEHEIQNAKLKFRVLYYCPLGENYSKADVTLDIGLKDRYAELLDMNEYFSRELMGINLSQEELCGVIFEKMMEVYEPKSLTVEVFADGHIPMTVTKSYKSI